MNKKGQFVALLGLFFVLGLIAAYFIADKGTVEVVRMYYTPADVLNQNFEIKEYLFDLNQNVKFSSFKALDDLSNFDLTKPLNLESDFKKYFVDSFDKSLFFDVSVVIKDNKFEISGKHKGKKIFEQFNVKTDVPVDFSYILDYDVSIFSDLYENCRNIFNCDDLKECKVNRCSSKDNYINMEKNLDSNGFIEPVIKFGFKFEKLEG